MIPNTILYRIDSLKSCSWSCEWFVLLLEGFSLFLINKYQLLKFLYVNFLNLSHLCFWDCIRLKTPTFGAVSVDNQSHCKKNTVKVMSNSLSFKLVLPAMRIIKTMMTMTIGIQLNPSFGTGKAWRST